MKGGLEAGKESFRYHIERRLECMEENKPAHLGVTHLTAKFSSAKVDVPIVNISSYHSILAFLKRCESLPPLDITILNAGLGQPSYERNEGASHEVTFQINYLSTVLLALVFVPVLQNKHGLGSPARLSLVGSDISYYAKWNSTESESIMEIMDNQDYFNFWEAYKTTKLCLLMFARVLSKRVSSSDVTINVSNSCACRGIQFGQTERYMLQEAVLYMASLILGRTPTLSARKYVGTITMKGAGSHGSFVSEGTIKA